MKRVIEKQSINSWLSAISGSEARDTKLFRRVSELASLPKRRRIAVNMSKLNKVSNEGESIIIPGKLLAAGTLDHSLDVCAIEYSKDALKKLKAAKCNILGIEEMLKKKPRIII